MRNALIGRASLPHGAHHADRARCVSRCDRHGDDTESLPRVSHFDSEPTRLLAKFHMRTLAASALMVGSASCATADVWKQKTAEVTKCPADEIIVREKVNEASGFFLATALHMCAGQSVEAWEADACGTFYECTRNPINADGPATCVPQRRLAAPPQAPYALPASVKFVRLPDTTDALPVFFALVNTGGPISAYLRITNPGPHAVVVESISIDMSCANHSVDHRHFKLHLAIPPGAEATLQPIEDVCPGGTATIIPSISELKAWDKP